MKFYLQQGYGMMQLNKEFAEKYSGIGYILSPRSLNKKSEISKIKQHVEELRKFDVEILFDPQFYEPRTNIDKITKFPYFENLNYETTEFNNENAKRFSAEVIKYQENTLNVDKIIIPGTYSNNFNEDWISLQESLVDGALALNHDKKYFQTISIGSEFVMNDGFDEFVSVCSLSEVDGFYFTLKKPDDSEYMIKNTKYLYRILNAFLSLNLAGKEIILGYADQQDLLFAAGGISGFATGNYQNVRSFDPLIFFDDDGDGIKRRGVWYYDDNTFSEFKPEQMDLAKDRNIFEVFGPVNEYNETLLLASNISSIKWSESSNFKNYLYSMKKHCDSFQGLTGNFGVEKTKEIFSERKSNIESLLEKRFRLGNRGFSIDAFDATLGALEAIEHDRKEDILDLQ